MIGRCLLTVNIIIHLKVQFNKISTIFSERSKAEKYTPNGPSLENIHFVSANFKCQLVTGVSNLDHNMAYFTKD